jgi:hypothetical protein
VAKAHRSARIGSPIEDELDDVESARMELNFRGSEIVVEQALPIAKPNDCHSSYRESHLNPSRKQIPDKVNRIAIIEIIFQSSKRPSHIRGLHIIQE